MADITISINITYSTLKLPQDGAYIMTENFNRTHPNHDCVVQDKIFKWDKFLEIAIYEQYEKEKAIQSQLDQSAVLP